MGDVVGIDLGTTNSAIARPDPDGNPVVLPNAEGKFITPSVICFKDGGTIVGDEAKELQAIGKWPVAAFFKRQMGDPLFLFQGGDESLYTATDLSAMVLKKLKADAETYIHEPVTHAVITVPAYFRDVERKATIDAGEAAGLEILQLINEPTAAAVAYGLSGRKDGSRIMVYDLGGGTFDITLLEFTKDGIKVMTSDGDHQLGGKDWDDRIIEFLADRFQSEFGVDPLEDAESLADLLFQAEQTKKKLTSLQSTSISIVHGGHKGRYKLDREKFEELTADLMERTISLTRRVLEDMSLQPDDVDGVLLVGGSTRMPMVSKCIEATFGKPPMGNIDVDKAVVMGAAMTAAEQMASRNPSSRFTLRAPVKIVDVTNHSLGMIAVNTDRSAYVNSIILPKNKAIPSEETRPYQYQTHRHGENKIEVFMTQGESDAPAEVVYIGKYVIHDIPHEHEGITVIDVAYQYDRSGTVKVSARMKDTQKELSVTMEELPPDIPDRFLGVPGPVKTKEPEHVTAYLAFDLSLSMRGTPIAEAKKAAHGFLSNTDLNHSSLGIIAFSDGVKVKLEASQNARAISKAIDGLEVGETGCCNDEDPFNDVLELLRDVDGRRFAIVLADGVWNDQERAIERARACHRAEIDVIAIGFGSADREFLRRIASSDEASFFTTMDGLVETFSNIAQVLTETGGNVQPSGTGNTGRTGKLMGFLSRIHKE